MKVVAKRLQPRATNVAMASTATSRRNSSVEGKKLCGGSIKGLSEELEEEEEVGLALGFLCELWEQGCGENGKEGRQRVKKV
jgi:hypothetical protein